MKLKISKGVLAKDGTPYAARTIYAVQGEWNSPYPYSVISLCSLLANKEITSISIIDEDNRQFDLTDFR